jgi:hypothetical protein
MLKVFELLKKQQKDWPKWATQFAIADAWSKSMGSLFELNMTGSGGMNSQSSYPPEPQNNPEEISCRRRKAKTPHIINHPIGW